MAGVSQTTNRTLNKLAYGLANVAATVTSLTDGDMIPIAAAAADDYEIKMITRQNLAADLVASELGISTTELGFIDGVTAGTAAASKAVVLDASKGITTITSATITTLTAPTVNATNVDAGASGTAGTVDIFPATASKGKLAISVTDQTGDTTVSLVAGAMAAARTLTIPDPGAAASFVMTEGAQTLNGVKTFGSGVAFGAGATIDADSGTVTLSGNAGTLSKMAGVITTESLTTAGAGSQALTITNTVCAAADIILITQLGGTNTTNDIHLIAVPGAGSFVITVYNTTAATALNGTLILGFLIIKA